MTGGPIRRWKRIKAVLLVEMSLGLQTTAYFCLRSLVSWPLTLQSSPARYTHAVHTGNLSPLPVTVMYNANIVRARIAGLSRLKLREGRRDVFLLPLFLSPDMLPVNSQELTPPAQVKAGR